jgi:AcrR family transcriptional regulator
MSDRIEGEMAKAQNVGERRNQIGQVMGRKGHDTRARLVAAAARLVARRPLRELRVTDIAREAGLGPPNFYVYFSDVGAAVLAALEQHPQSSPELLQILERDWTAGEGLDQARAFVAAYLGSWKDNFALLRARNLAADEGDERFLQQRLGDIGPIHQGLTAKFEAALLAGRLPGGLRPAAAAGVMVAALERLAAAPRRGWDDTAAESELHEAAAYVLAASLGLMPEPS